MLTGTHAMIYAQDADKARAFLRDILKLPHVDAGRGWLIFALPPAELGIHPAEEGAQPGSHELFLMCDDVTKTVEDLKSRGVEFTRPITDAGWGLMTTFKFPGAGEMGLYQPRHPTAALKA